MAGLAHEWKPSQYVRGSEWRRWDLHVHTPETAREDEYTGWAPFIAALKAEKNVRVIGVTDYLSVDNYAKLLAVKASEGLGAVELLVPNIEFRVAPQTKKGSAINLHVIVDPADSSHIDFINIALSRLTIRYKDQPYSCTAQQLRALGAAYKPTLTTDRSKLEEGVNQFKIDFSTFHGWFKKEDWLLRNSLIAISAGEDGPSGLKDDGWAAVREELWRFAQIVFSGNPQNREFWLANEHSMEADAIKLGAPKPCVHGSDAHGLRTRPALLRSATRPASFPGRLIMSKASRSKRHGRMEKARRRPLENQRAAAGLSGICHKALSNVYVQKTTKERTSRPKSSR